MVFKRKPKPRVDPIAEKALERINEQSADERVATDAFSEGQQAEADGRPEDAIEAYQVCVEAWGQHHITTGISVPPKPYERLAILLRKARELEAEIGVLEHYMAHAGRSPDETLRYRLERVYELVEPAEPVD